MSDGSVVCPACGVKVRASRERCPRCRAFLPLEEPVGRSAPAGPVAPVGIDARIAAIALATAVAVVAGIWYVRRDPAPRVSTTSPGDPLSARRPAAAVSKGPTVIDPTVFPASPVFGVPPTMPPDTAGGDDVAALARYRTVIETAPHDARALFDIGRTLLRLGRVQESLGPLRQAVEGAPDQWPVAVTYGLASARGERWQDAVAAFRRARTLMPKDAVTSYDLALSLQNLADYQGAAQEYRLAISLDANAPSPRLGLAISLDRLGKAAEAVEAYGEAVRLMPAGLEADRIRARIAQIGG